MNKRQTIEYQTQEFGREIEAIMALPDLPEDLGYGVYSNGGTAKLDKTLESDVQLATELHILRGHLGDYKQNAYWIGYAGLVCVEYTFGATVIWFRIKTNDEQSTINMLSNGKCKVVEVTNKTVVCGV